MKDARLYVIIDHTVLPEGADLTVLTSDLIQGGADIIQYRDKDSTDDIFTVNAKEIAAATGKKIPFIINDRLHLAKTIGADGVHLGQNDTSPGQARKTLGAEAIIGATANTFEQAEAGWKDGADYIGMGAVFSTKTKKNTIALDMDVLIRAVKNSPVPVFAIGGINETNIESLIERKIGKICLSSAIIKEPQKALEKTKWFKAKIDRDGK